MSDDPELKKRKKELRAYILQKRDSLSSGDRERYSEQIAKKVLELPALKSSRHVLLYVSFRSEVGTKGLIDACVRERKTVWLPRIVSPVKMKFYRFAGWESLVVSRLGIREPAEDAAMEFCPEKALQEGCFCVLPGTVFDRNCGRMGYNGGYYDRFLAAFPQIFTCGICFSCQIVENVPMGTFDRRPDLVVTENEIYKRAAE